MFRSVIVNDILSLRFCSLHFFTNSRVAWTYKRHVILKWRFIRYQKDVKNKVAVKSNKSQVKYNFNTRIINICGKNVFLYTYMHI